jgi:hypothetical protein
MTNRVGNCTCDAVGEYQEIFTLLSFPSWCKTSTGQVHVPYVQPLQLFRKNQDRHASDIILICLIQYFRAVWSRMITFVTRDTHLTYRQLLKIAVDLVPFRDSVLIAEPFTSTLWQYIYKCVYLASAVGMSVRLLSTGTSSIDIQSCLQGLSEVQTQARVLIASNQWGSLHRIMVSFITSCMITFTSEVLKTA